MKKILFMLFCVLFLLSCGSQRQQTFKKDISDSLHPPSLRYSFSTQPINFKELSKCTTSNVSINLVNVEKINEDINIVPNAVFHQSRYGYWKINPRELIDQTIAYMEDSFRQCRVFNNVLSLKILQISLEKLEGTPNGAFKFNGDDILKLNISIPEKKYTETFTSIQSSGDLHMAIAYSIHDITWQIINDPIIQDYILCRD